MPRKPPPRKPAAKKVATRSVAAPVATPAADTSADYSDSYSSDSSGATMEDIISGLVQVRSTFGSALSTLSAKQTAEATRLQELRTQIDTTSRQIRELHGSDVTENSLSEIIAQHQKGVEAHQKEMAERQEALDVQLADMKRGWEKEKLDRARTVAEDNEAYNKVQQRETQEYTYGLQQKRDLDNDAYEHQKKHSEADLAEFKAKKEREWFEREKAIAEQEKQYTEAKGKVDEAPAKLEAATKKAREEGKNIAIAQAKIKADLIAKEIEGEKRLHDLKIKGLEDSIKESTARIAQLTKQLSDAVAQAQGLAIKSIEGASNASTFSAVREIALEQAKNLPKNK